MNNLNLYINYIIDYGYYIATIILIIFIYFDFFSFKKIKLSPELIPYKMHYKNVRAVLSEEDWRMLSKITQKKSNYSCSICGSKENLECHETWDFNDKKLIQKLIGLVTLCRNCHRVKHIGLARKMGYYEDTLGHMAKVNNISKRKAQNLVSISEQQVKKRNKEYSLDLTFLNNYKDILPRQYSYHENQNCQNRNYDD